MSVMEGGVFIADSRLFFSQELAAVLRDKGVRVLLTGNKNDEDERLKCKYEIEWDRASLVSLQSLPLQLKNLKVVLDVAVLTFDSMAYLNLYPFSNLMGIDEVCTELITANIALTTILKDYFLNLGVGKMVFVYRAAPLPSENPSIMAASGAFIKLAEETVSCLLKEEKGRVQTLLIKLEEKDEDACAFWLSNQLELSSFAKMQGKWIKAGQRGLFGKY